MRPFFFLLVDSSLGSAGGVEAGFDGDESADGEEDEPVTGAAVGFAGASVEAGVSAEVALADGVAGAAVTGAPLSFTGCG